MAEELGFGSGRRKRSSRRRQKASKTPSRSRHIPEEINMKVGDATMAYTMGRCVWKWCCLGLCSWQPG